jgi:hypothetical protein
VQLLPQICLLTEEKIFIVEYYFHSYASGHEGGLSSKRVAEQLRERLNTMATSNTVTLYTVSEFPRRALTTEGEAWSTSNCFDKRESHTCSPAGGAFAPTKSTTNGFETKHQQYVRSPTV